MGRPPIGDRPMTAVERQRRRRARLREKVTHERVMADFSGFLDRIDRAPPALADAILRDLAGEIAGRRRQLSERRARRRVNVPRGAI
jgi:hypothetical protein